MYKDGVNPGVVDIEEFAEIPPSKCKKGGATFRTGCGDDGYPIRDKKKVFFDCKSMFTKLVKRPFCGRKIPSLWKKTNGEPKPRYLVMTTRALTLPTCQTS